MQRLPDVCEDAMETFIAIRSSADIDDDNDFLFQLFISTTSSADNDMTSTTSSPTTTTIMSFVWD